MAVVWIVLPYPCCCFGQTFLCCGLGLLADLCWFAMPVAWLPRAQCIARLNITHVNWSCFIAQLSTRFILFHMIMIAFLTYCMFSNSFTLQAVFVYCVDLSRKKICGRTTDSLIRPCFSLDVIVDSELCANWSSALDTSTWSGTR